MRKPGIHLRLLGAAFFLICAATFILDVVGVHVTREFMYKRFHDRISFLAKYLALNSEVGVLINDTSGLNVLALNLLGEEDVSRVVIYDNNDKALVRQERNTGGPLSVVETPVVLKRSRTENLLFQDFDTPIGKIPHDGEEFIGRVQITYSTRGIDQLIYEMTFKYLWFSAVLAIFAGGVFFFISRSIVNEVKQLAQAARQVGQGDLALRVTPGKIPETRSLANDFNAMLNFLQQSRAALDKANQEMIKQTALAEVGKFSLMIAHEVKNPLGIIKSSLDILKRGPEAEQQALMIDYIEDEVKGLNTLIEDFLRFARPTKPDFKRMDLNEMLDSVLERFVLQCQAMDVKIESDIPAKSVHTVADRNLLTKSLNNIIKNAVEAVDGSGTVSVTASDDARIWTVTVTDTGAGIETDPVEMIFEPFFTTRAKGTGLGLAFVAQAVRAHQGEVGAENRSGGGARFWISIPLRPDAGRGDPDPAN